MTTATDAPRRGLISGGLLFLGGMLAQYVVGGILSELTRWFIAPRIDKIRFKGRFIETVRYEVASSLSNWARMNGLSSDISNDEVDSVVKDILNNPDVKRRIDFEAKKLSANPNDTSVQQNVAKNIANVLSQEGIRVMDKKIKGHSEISELAVVVPWTARSMLKAAGLPTQGTLGRKLSLSIGFMDGDDTNYVTIENGGKSLQINPATREVYLNQPPRRVYLGALDTWNTRSIQSLILRYLGILPDSVVNSTLRDLGLIEMTSTSNIPVIPLGLDRGAGYVNWGNNKAVYRKQRRL